MSIRKNTKVRRQSRQAKNAAVDAVSVDRLLPKTFFVTRGDIATAFGLSKAEMAALVDCGTFAAKYPFGKEHRRARFVRSQVLEIASEWCGDNSREQNKNHNEH